MAGLDPATHAGDAPQAAAPDAHPVGWVQPIKPPPTARVKISRERSASNAIALDLTLRSVAFRLVLCDSSRTQRDVG